MAAGPSPACLLHGTFRHNPLTDRRHPATQWIRRVLLLAFTCGAPFHSQFSFAQNTQGYSRLPANRSPQAAGDLAQQFEQVGVVDDGSTAPAQPPSHTCLFEPYPGMSHTVSVHSLRAPEKAQNEFQKACIALGAKKFRESEQHLRKAIEIYPIDAMGWVMLGKVLELTTQWDEARQACSRAILHDPSYWPAELCLAEIDGLHEKWTDVLAESNLALSLHPQTKTFADYYSAIALFNLNKVADAESRAREGEQLDHDHAVPPLEFLLAQIAEVKGDIAGAVTKLREYLKYAKDDPQTGLAKQQLARLEVQVPKGN
jgi:Tetratricopeptide repeat